MAFNEALRKGLQGGPSPKDPVFEIVARPLGLREGIDPSRLHDLDDELEVEEFLRTSKALDFDLLNRQMKTKP